MGVLDRHILSGHGSVLVAVLAVIFGTCSTAYAQTAIPSPEAPGCQGTTARQCLDRAVAAMGGRDQLAAIRTVRLDVIRHTALMEQSYRQAPFITSYERDQVLIDFAEQRIRSKEHVVWPESDLKGADADQTLIVTRAGGIISSDGQAYPAGASNLDAARETLALGPETVLLSAAAAPDLRFLPAEELRSSLHAVLGFTWKNVPVRILLNPFNHLPDAIESTQQFRDFWYYWGDVEQRVYFDNWRFVQGIRIPSNEIIERNGAVWSSSQALDIEFNVAADDSEFAQDQKIAQLSTQSKGWKRAFSAAQDKELAPGIDLFLGSWNATVVKQPDGIVILEAPISGKYAEGIFAEAKKRYPGENIKAVLSTSDSWPHVGGIRYVVAHGIPVYILDLNQPLLDRMLKARHTIDPDALELSKTTPLWRIVSEKTEIGTGENRLVLYPLRGASTERQYMVYFPERRVLYASDTLVLNSDQTLYDPELMREVEEAVDREHLVVDTVFAMHQGPAKWKDVVNLIEAGSKGAPAGAHS